MRHRGVLVIPNSRVGQRRVQQYFPRENEICDGPEGRGGGVMFIKFPGVSMDG